LRDADDDGGEMLATAMFSFCTKAVLSKREIEQDVIRKAKYLFSQAANGVRDASEGGAGHRIERRKDSEGHIAGERLKEAPQLYSLSATTSLRPFRRP
jgi:hypothetical protein